MLMSRLFCFDVETTGINPACDEIVSLAWRLVDAHTLSPIDSGVLYAHPTTPMDPEVAAINGYSFETWNERGASTHTQMAADLYTIFACHSFRSDRPFLMGYNVGFDAAFLAALIHRSRLNAAFALQRLDVMNAVMFVEHAHGRFERLKLTEACKRHSVEFTNAHDAIADVTATVELYRKLRGFVTTQAA
jgi:DNA polymerase III alpha subunit (gram-positive type)